MSDPTPDVKSVFGHALERPTAAERAAYLDAACAGFPAVRAEVDALLRALDRAGSFLEQRADSGPTVSAADFAATRDPEGTKSVPLPTEAVGTLIAGQYKLLQQIGEGGMGTVWMADQTEPVKRRVAVKLIRTERGNSATILARFEAERQAIALMDHPHIAKLLDAGTWSPSPPAGEGLGVRGSGQPYFVMELVKGVPLTDYCDAHKLSIPDRLQLFMQICSAVQHAHQKGVIHRDLKPTNILVESHDGKPVPKVIDFGLAKATSGLQLTEHTLFTGFGSVMGTPLYMAPEQATFNAVDVDTRADVYALGVILYELLTGTTPLTRETIKKAQLDEMLRLIREQEAPTPSSRVGTAHRGSKDGGPCPSYESLPTVAANRQTEPAKLGRFVRGELDWIVLKALSKDRDRRYDTANGFAKDVERFLHHEPVQAGPVGAGYKLRKFVQRNRGQVIAASLVLAALLAGIAGTTFGLLRAEDKRREAEEAKERERERADGEQKAKEQEAEQRAKAEAEKKKADKEKERALQNLGEALETLLAATGPDVEKLIGSRTDLTANERAYLEAVAKRWQDFAKGRETAGEALLYMAEGYTRVAKLWRKLGRLEEARTQFEAARDSYEKLTRVASVVPETRRRLADAHNDLGVLLADLGKRQEAGVEHAAARELRKKLAEEYPAEAAYQRDLASAHVNLGIQFANSGQGQEALTEFRTARELLLPLAAKFPEEKSYTHNLAMARLNLGLLLEGLGRREEARAELIAARDLRERVMKRFPADVEDRQELAVIRVALGEVFQRLSRREEACREFEAARNAFKELVEQFPAVPHYRSRLADVGNKLGLLLFDLGERDAATAEHRTAREQREKLAEQFPRVPQYRIDLGGSYCNYGQELYNAGKLAESLEWLDKAVRTLQEVYDADPRAGMAKEFLRNSHQNRGVVYDDLRKYADALRDFDRAVELSQPEVRNQYRLGRAAARHRAGLLAEAVEDIAAFEKTEKLLPEYWFSFASVCAQASGKLTERKQENAELAVSLLRKAVNGGFKDLFRLKASPHLVPLRGREDFQKLLAELEAKFPPKREVLPAPRKD